MKKANRLLFAVVLFVFLNAAGLCFAQGTAFTYQGLLTESNGPANGSYDLTFKLFNALSGPSQVGSTITDTATTVSNGLFTVVLDFGAQYNGTSYWLELGVRSNGVGSFFTLSPRQELTPTPYAVTAENLDGTLLASQLTGTLPSGLLSGIYAGPLTLNNAANSFTGNGSGLTGIDALTLDGLGPNNFWQTTGNAGTSPGVNFLGTTDGQGLELRAPFVGINRTVPVTGDDVFAVTSPTTNYYGGMYVDTVGSNTLPFYGYSLAGNAVAWTFIDGQASDEWMLFNNGFWLTVATNGYTGLGMTFPSAPLDLLSRNLWDVFNPGTPGDFRLGDGTQGLKIGVATGGGGAGDVRIFAYGGTSRLILGSSNYDGMVTLNGHSVGINTLGPAQFASLDVESTNTDGVFGTTSYSGGNGVVGEADIGGDAYGVLGTSASGYGVVGQGFGGTGIGVWGSSAVPTSGIGVLAQGANQTSPALSINQGTFQVQGAGFGTHTAAFIHKTSAANSFFDWSIIDNPVCNGDPNAILMVTHVYNPHNDSTIETYEPHPYGVFYTDPNWAIYNDDEADMATNIAFNVLVIKP